MAVETEIKVRLAAPELFRRQVASVSRMLHPRHFEDNYLLDFADGRMKSRMSLLRIRLAQGKAWMTYKGPPQPEGIFKVREELETSIEDAAAALEVFARLDLHVWFRYQKYREEYAVPVQGRPVEEVRLAVDETPVGAYAELEGSVDAIRTAAAVLGLDESMFLRASYYSLYLQHCAERGEKPGDMVFPAEARGMSLPV